MKLPKPGDLFAARYRIEAQIGAGGFATVHRAVQLDSNELVAIKVLRPDADGYDPATRARFEREVRVLGQLRDPHTVKLLDHGATDEGELFLVSELVDGRDLSEILGEAGTLEARVVIHILRQVMLSLREAHRAGLIHRDLKPANIRIFESSGDPWTVRVLDFGIARVSDDGHPSITRTGELIGTPRYMSPEQLTSHPLTAASDIYSAGMLGFELVFGRQALAGNRLHDQLDRLVGDHVFTAPTTGLVDPRLVALLQRMTARRVEDRVQTADAVLAELARLAGKPPSTDTGAGSRISVRSVVVAAVAVIAAALAVLAITRREAATDLEVQQSSNVKRLLEVKPIDHVPVVAPQRDTPDIGAIVAPSQDGCGIEPTFSGTEHLSSGTQAWLMHVPEKYQRDRPYPLVILLHPRGQTAQELLSVSGFDALADREGFVVAAPIDKGAWDDTRTNAEAIEHVMRETAAKLCIDRTRVFVVAQASSGRLAERLHCADWTRAVATHAARRTVDEDDPCFPPEPKPFLLMSPRLSGHDPFDGGFSCAMKSKRSVSETERFWLVGNECGEEQREVFEWKKDSVCVQWDCKAPFESCYINGGHNWPGAQPRRAFLPQCEGPMSDFPMAERVWAFFDSVSRDDAN